MQVIALGTGTALPHPYRGPAGYIVQSRQSRILLDCGGGTIQRLALAHVALDDLDAIFLTHPHLDHTGELPAIMFAQRIPGHHRSRPLHLHMHERMRPWLDGLGIAYGDWMQPRGAQLIVHEHVDGSRFDVGELSCWVREVDHHPASLGIRISSPDGCRMAYTGDTDLCDAAIELCRGVDLALVECSYTDEADARGHMCPRKVATLANAAKPEAVVLTHLYPETSATNVVGAVRAHGTRVSIVLGEDGMGVALDPAES